MTTRISNTNIGTDDVNSALGSPFPSNKVNIGKKNIIRRLSGDAGRQEETTQISSSNIANKLVLGDLTIVDNSSVTVIDHGSADVPVVSYIIVEASTDIFNPTYQWQFSILDDYASGVLLADISGQQITGFPNRYRIQLSNNNTTTSPNKRALIRATANLFVAQPGQGVTTDPHFVGAKTIDFELRSQVLDAGLVVTESGSKTASSFAPTSVSYQYSASSAAFPGAVYEWSASLVSGIAATIVNNGSTIQFSLTNNNKGTTRSSTYNIEVKMWKDSTKTDLMSIARFVNQTFSAEYKEAFLSIGVNSTNAKSFAQNSTVNPYADLTASFASESGTTIEWSYSPSFASGTSNVSTGSTSTSNTQRVGFTVPSGTYQLRSETYSVTASQKYSNGFVIASASASFKIAGGNWGHEFSAPPSSVAEGYAAQTAISSVSSIVRAPQATHAWTFTRNTGTAAVISGQTTYTPTLQLTASSAGQDLNNNYTITSRASYDGESSSISRPLSMRAAFLSQTTSMSGNSSATAIVNTGTATASLPISITTTVASPTIEWSATNGVSIAPLTGATTTATLSALNAENIKSFNITATVKDSQGRVVTSITQPRTLTATSFNATFNAPSSVSNSGIGVRTISGVYTGNTVFGGMTMSATRVSGDVLTVSTTAGRVTISGNTDADPATTTPLTLSSVYRITGTPVSPSGLSGAPFTADVSLSCISSGSAAKIEISGICNNKSGFTSTVTSATTASVLGNEPGTSVRWLTPVVVSGVATPVVTNGSTTQSYSLTQTTIGTSSVTLKARAEILDSNAVVVSTIESAAFTLSATRLSTQLNLSFAGSYTAEAINGQASSFADATATSAIVPGHSIQIVPTSVDSVVAIGTQTGSANQPLTYTATLPSVGASAMHWFGDTSTGNNIGNSFSSSSYNSMPGDNNLFLVAFELKPNSSSFSGIVATVYVEIDNVRVWSEPVTLANAAVRILRQINYTWLTLGESVKIGVESSGGWNGEFSRNAYAVDFDNIVWSSVSQNTSLSPCDPNFGIVTGEEIITGTGGNTFERYAYVPTPVGSPPWVGWGSPSWATNTLMPVLMGDTDSTTGPGPVFPTVWYQNNTNAQAKVLLANFQLGPNIADVGKVVTLYAELNNVRVWSQSITVSSVQPIIVKRQINNPNQLQVKIGYDFSASWIGSRQIATLGIAEKSVYGDYDGLNDELWRSVSSSTNLSPTDSDYGVITDGTNYRYALSIGSITWGSPTWLIDAYNRTRKFSVVSTGGTVLGGGQIEARLVNTANGAILDTIQANLPTLQAKSYFLTNTLKSATGTANIYEGETNYPSPSYKWTVNGATGSALQSVILPKPPAQTITYSIATTSGGYFTADATSVGLELTGTGITHSQVTADFPPISKTNTTVTFSAITGQLTAEDLNTSVEAFANISVTSTALPPGQTLTSTVETLIGGAWVAGAGNSGAVITSTGTNSWRVGLTASSIFRQTTHRLSAYANGTYYYSESFTLTANSYELFLQLDTKKNVDSFNALPNTSSASRTYFWVSSTGIGTGASVTLSKTGNASISGATISGARTPTDGAGTTTFSGNVVATIVGGPMNGKTASIPYSFDVVLYEMLNILLNSSSGTTSVDTSGTPNFGSQYKVASTRNYSGTGGRPPYTYIWTQTDALRMALLSSTTNPSISVEGIYNKYEIVNGFISLELRVTDADGRTMTSPVTINGTASYTRTGNIAIGNFGSSATVDTSSTARVEDVLVNPSITGASADAAYTWSLLNNVGGWTIVSGQGTSTLTIRASANRLETKEASVNVRLTIVDPMAANGSPQGTVSKDFTVIRLFEPFVGNGGSGGGGGGDGGGQVG